MTTQSIIVYRNPLEAAIWEALMNGGGIVVLAVIAAGLIAAGVTVWVDKMYWSSYRRSRGNNRFHKAVHHIVAALFNHAGWAAVIVFCAALYTMHWWSVYR